MKKLDVHIGDHFTAKVSGQIVSVRIDAESPYGGWIATSVVTGRAIRIKTAARLRRRVDPTAPRGTVRTEVS